MINDPDAELVARALRELQHDGVVQGRGRNGTFVADEPPESEPLLERRRRLDDAATTFAFAAQQLGIVPDAAVAAVQAAFARLVAGGS